MGIPLERTVVVEDLTKPVITLIGDPIVIREAPPLSIQERSGPIILMAMVRYTAQILSMRSSPVFTT